MKKFLLLLTSFFGIVLAALAQTTAKFDFTNPTGLNPSVTPDAEASKTGVSVTDQVFTDNGVTLMATKGTNDAKIWTSSTLATDLRVYKNGGTITITAPAGENIKSIAFDGKKVNDMTVENGTYANPTWTGSANSVVFTAIGTLNINTITVTYGEGGSVNPDPTPDPTPDPSQKSTLFSEDFQSGLGQFTVQTVTAPDSTFDVWTHYASTKYGNYAKASAYAKRAFTSEVWLVSPEIDLTQASKLSLSFSHAINKGNADEMAQQQKLYVKANGGEWAEVAIATYPAGTNWTFVDNTQDFSAYDGKKIQLAFAYSSSATSCGTWEVKNLKIEGEGNSVTPEPEVPHYASLAEMQAAASTTKVSATLTADNLLVTGVGLRGKNYTTYVTDGTTSAILYGANKPIAQKGDKLSGMLSGNVVVYNSALELDAADFEKATVASSGNEVKPEVLTIATLGNDQNATYQSRYVRLENVNFEADSLLNSNVNLIDDSDNTIVLRDNFNVLGDFVFDTTKPYNVNAYVAYFKGQAQLYVCSAEDLQIITSLKDAETSWETDTIANLPGQERLANALRTLSDGAKTFTSSNEQVATVDAEGSVTFVGFGHTVITVETAETANYLASKASYDLYYIEGEGTLENAYTAADVEYFNGRTTEKVWVKGTIIGYISNTSTGAYSPADDKVVATNLALGSEDQYVPVQLPSKSEARTNLNLKDNPDMQGKTVWVYGDLAVYCGKPGVKNVSAYSLDGVTGISLVTSDEQAARQIFSIDGRRLSQPVKGINIINGRKVLVK